MHYFVPHYMSTEYSQFPFPLSWFETLEIHCIYYMLQFKFILKYCKLVWYLFSSNSLITIIWNKENKNQTWLKKLKPKVNLNCATYSIWICNNLDVFYLFTFRVSKLLLVKKSWWLSSIFAWNILLTWTFPWKGILNVYTQTIIIHTIQEDRPWSDLWLL